MPRGEKFRGSSSEGSLGVPAPLGEFAEPSFVRLPEPVTLFGKRAKRLRAVAQGHTLAPYLDFLVEIATAQERLAASAVVIASAAKQSPANCTPSGGLLRRDAPRNDTTRAPVAALEDDADSTRPPLDRLRFVVDEPVLGVADALFATLKGCAMPAPTQDAIERFLAANAAQRQSVLQCVLVEPVPLTEALAEYGLLSAALQVVFSGMAAGLEGQQLRPVGDGACPVCGSPPLASLLVGWPGARNTRYCACGLCGSLWNYVRIKCTLCGSTKGIAYQEIEGDAGTIKAETCEACRRYVKILHQHKDPELEPLADDVASLGLDLLLRETGFARGGVNPFLLGY